MPSSATSAQTSATSAFVFALQPNAIAHIAPNIANIAFAFAFRPTTPEAQHVR